MVVCFMFGYFIGYNKGFEEYRVLGNKGRVLRYSFDGNAGRLF